MRFEGVVFLNHFGCNKLELTLSFFFFFAKIMGNLQPILGEFPCGKIDKRIYLEDLSGLAE